MASVLGDLWQVTDFQLYLEQQVLNVYFYRVTSVTGVNDDGYDDMLDWFETNIITPVRAIQIPALNHFQLEIRNLSNGVDITTRAEDLDGTRSAGSPTPTPSYVSAGFKLIRESLVTRNGYKRYAGISEGDTTGNEFALAGSSLTDDIEAALASDVVLGLVTVAEPVIVHHPIGTPPVTSYTYSSIGDAAVKPTLGSQNTRKPGRGV